MTNDKLPEVVAGVFLFDKAHVYRCWLKQQQHHQHPGQLAHSSTRRPGDIDKKAPTPIRPPQVGHIRPREKIWLPIGRPRGSTFLVSGGQSRPTGPHYKPIMVRPFDRLLLILAGDVEENLGPITPPVMLCIPCRLPVRDSDSVKCSTSGCEAASHKVSECSGTTLSWTYPAHRE